MTELPNLPLDAHQPRLILSHRSYPSHWQIDMPRRVMALPVAGRVTGLELEAACLRDGAAEKDREKAKLRDRVTLLDCAL